MSMDRWRGRTAMVTGASSGIGRAVSEMLLREGVVVAAVGRREERLRALGEDAIALPADLRDPDQILRAFARVREERGGVDVLVNAAGVGFDAPLVSGDHERWREMLDVNVLALCICTREAVSDMRRRGDDGHVIHVSSMSGHRVPRGSDVYAATKYAVRALTEALRLELRDLESGIRVSAISPGVVETEFHRRAFGAETARDLYAQFPPLRPEDVADTIRHVLSLPAHAEVHDVLMRPTRQTS